MTALAVAPTLFGQRGGEPTLDDVIVGAWEGLAAHRPVECPMCEGELVPEWGADGRTLAGRCTSCGTVLC